MGRGRHLRQPIRSKERGHPQGRLTPDLFRPKCRNVPLVAAHASGGGIFKQKKQGTKKIQPPAFDRGPSPVAVIGASACTAGTILRYQS